MEKMSFTSPREDKIVNLLSEKNFTYNHICKLLRNKDIKIDGQRIKENIIVEKDSEITLFYESDKIAKINIPVIYQDKNILIVNKPKNIEVETENGVAKFFNAFAVHRLDRNTTGLLILAKNLSAKSELEQIFKKKAIDKKYLCEVVGKTNFHNQTCSAFLYKNAKESIVKIFDSPVKDSSKIINIFNTISSSPASSVIECSLITGKTHQIRAHLAKLGHPIIGDGKYGRNEDNKKFKEKSQRLHCYYIKFHKLNGILAYLSNQEFVCYPSFINKKNI